MKRRPRATALNNDAGPETTLELQQGRGYGPASGGEVPRSPVGHADPDGEGPELAPDGFPTFSRRRTASSSPCEAPEERNGGRHGREEDEGDRMIGWRSGFHRSAERVSCPTCAN